MNPTSSSPENESTSPKLSLKRDDDGDSLEIETPSDDQEVVLSSNSDGSSLTLLEEYSIRESNSGRWAALFAFICAAISLTFAFMIFKTL